MTKIVDLDPILRHITKKLIADRQALDRLLAGEEPDDLKEFSEQERLLEHIQAAVRALDILEHHDSAEATMGHQPGSPFDTVESLLSEALRPNGAAH